MVKLLQLEKEDVDKYRNVFTVSFDIFGVGEGEFFKYVFDGEEKILQRIDDTFITYELDQNGMVSYRMFTMNDDYTLNTLGLEEKELKQEDGITFIGNPVTGAYECLSFIQREENDVDSYDGVVIYSQYNPDCDVRFTMAYQDVYRANEVVYSFRLRDPYQVGFESNLTGKRRKNETYIKMRFDMNVSKIFYDIATIKDFGLSSYLSNGSYELQRQSEFYRYSKILRVRSDGKSITLYPFTRQYMGEVLFDKAKELGFNVEVPDELISFHNGGVREMVEAREVLEQMRILDEKSNSVSPIRYIMS